MEILCHQQSERALCTLWVSSAVTQSAGSSADARAMT